MNPFVTMRCFEQVRTDLGYGERNVKVIGGYGSGISFAGWGCTHHAMEGPFYVSLAGGALPISEDERTFEVGKAALLREGNDVTVIGVGLTVRDALKAGDILASKGIAARVLNAHTVKPIDKDAILRAAAETRLILTIEEHTVIGGLGGAVAEVLAEAGVDFLQEANNHWR